MCRTKSLLFKTCSCCNRTLPIDNFYIRSYKDKNTLKSIHKEWRREHPNYSKEWAERNKSKIRLSQIKYNYNLTEEEYEALPKACEVCGSTKNLCIDHNHITGKVRGVLCSRCNSALDLLGDSKEVILKLASYIEKQ